MVHILTDVLFNAGGACGLDSLQGYRYVENNIKAAKHKFLFLTWQLQVVKKRLGILIFGKNEAINWLKNSIWELQ